MTPKLKSALIKAAKARREVSIELFMEFVAPVMKEHDWRIDFGMGGAAFVNKEGKDVFGSDVDKAINALTNFAEKNQNIIRPKYALFDLMIDVTKEVSGCLGEREISQKLNSSSISDEFNM